MPKMIFRYINIETDNGKPVYWVNKRLEYFHNYWSFLFQKNSRLLFVTNEKFESHRTLLKKLELQVKNNPYRGHDRIEAIINHPYFNDNNILLKNRVKTKAAINKFKVEFSNWKKKINKSTNKKSTSTDRAEGITAIDYMRNQTVIISKLIFKESSYRNSIIDLLKKQLCKNSKIDEAFKTNIQFLVNALIIELYSFGYSLSFIQKIPDIILFPEKNIYSFPFDKKYSDFQSEKDYRKYQEEAAKKIKLNDQLLSIANLFKAKKLKGHYIFKIDNFDFQEKDSITIWNVTFYNPKIDTKVKCITKEWKKEVKSVEQYFEMFVNDNKKEKLQSSCNAIIETEYMPLYWGKSDNSLIDAVNNANKSLQVLKQLKHNYVGKSNYLERINFSKYILVDETFEYRQDPAFDRKFNAPFKIKDRNKGIFKRNLKWINKPNIDISFQKKLIDIYAYHTLVFNNPNAFNFSDYWTVLSESLYPNNRIGFIRCCQDCFKYKIYKSLFLDTKTFLGSSLEYIVLFDGMPCYLLKERQLQRMDLWTKSKNRFNAKRFEKVYPNIKKYFDIEFINDIVNELDFYVENPTEYFDKVNSWIETIIYEVYAERNLETHNNISSEISSIKLKDTFLFIGSVLYQVLINNCKHNTNNIEDVLNTIKK